jgi:hypothetical protein
MPSDFWETGDWEYNDSKGFGDDYGRLYDDVFGGQAELGWQDDFAKMLFDIAFVHPDESPDVNASARDMLYEWMEQEYGIDFEADFDWETWRELYG